MVMCGLKAVAYPSRMSKLSLSHTGEHNLTCIMATILLPATYVVAAAAAVPAAPCILARVGNK